MNTNNTNTLHSGNLNIDLAIGQLNNHCGDSVRLSPVLLKLLEQLLLNDGKVVSRSALFDTVWPNQIVSDDVLTRAMSDLRVQLTKLDDAQKYIETLPKRGYRWSQPALAGIPEDIHASGKAVTNESVELNVSATRNYGWFGRALGYSFVSMLLAIVLMWVLAQLSVGQEIRLAVLPSQVDATLEPHTGVQIDNAILETLRKNNRIQLISSSAVAARPGNPFPYFFSEFDADWVLETRVTEFDGLHSVELILVDARTGLELRSSRVQGSNRAELHAKLAKILDSNFLAKRAP